MRKDLLVLAFALASATAGCKKDGLQLSTPDNLLSGTKWKLISNSSLINLPGFTPLDNYALLLPCNKDDFQQFNASNVYAYNEGPTKCDPSDPQEQPGLWFLGNFGTQLTITYDGFSTNYTVDQLTAVSLKMHSVQQNNGIEETTSLVYKAVN
ncbi:hypothetical protein [Hymenobacter coccineus]|uniref:Lipocalin-like domain-containing protein n=1 Tax=Hymenobacter coccineus TaxID=1908235 RepID=A0A1G1TKW9_9BACT|nr:hypothetical protein [Hymenobacter coccineus]OGX91495.1 hypothetical protein BEN49_04800 [Hymenobacter coccineus]